MSSRIRDTVNRFWDRCCNQLKDYVLARWARSRQIVTQGGDKCEIKCDLSDERTFFAWQRNHMANERTFLAWCRTGISLIVFGFVIERFDLLIRQIQSFSPGKLMFKHTGTTHYVGMVTFLLGSFIIVLAGWRFFYIRKHINAGETEFSTIPDVFLMVSILATVLMILLLFVFLF